MVKNNLVIVIQRNLDEFIEDADNSIFAKLKINCFHYRDGISEIEVDKKRSDYLGFRRLIKEKGLTFHYNKITDKYYLR